jgi:hypothetical protein
VLATREVGAPDRAGEQDIADPRAARSTVEKHDVARRVAGAVQHFEQLFSDADRIAVFKPAIRLERLGRGQAELRRRHRQRLDPEAVGALRPFDRQPARADKLGRCRAMVDVRMRQQDLCQRQATPVGRFEQPWQFPTRIDIGGTPLFIP